MITQEEFLNDTSEEELFCLIGSFLNRVKDRDLFKIGAYDCIEGNLILLDSDKIKIVREMLKEFKK